MGDEVEFSFVKTSPPENFESFAPQMLALASTSMVITRDTVDRFVAQHLQFCMPLIFAFAHHLHADKAIQRITISGRSSLMQIATILQTLQSLENLEPSSPIQISITRAAL